MNKWFLKLDFIEIERQQFHSSKDTMTIDAVDIDKILLSQKFACGKEDQKYFIRYKNEEHLCIKLSQMIGYVKHFVDAKTISFFCQRWKVTETRQQNMRES